MGDLDRLPLVVPRGLTSMRVASTSMRVAVVVVGRFRFSPMTVASRWFSSMAMAAVRPSMRVAVVIVRGVGK